MMREYEAQFGYTRHPRGYCVEEAMLNDAYEPCNCHAYKWVHTWGVGRCHRPQYWCEWCKKPCGESEKRMHGEDGASDCCLFTLCDSYREANNGPSPHD